jgi:hypothetical protein
VERDVVALPQHAKPDRLRRQYAKHGVRGPTFSIMRPYSIFAHGIHEPPDLCRAARPGEDSAVGAVLKSQEMALGRRHIRHRGGSDCNSSTPGPASESAHGASRTHAPSFPPPLPLLSPSSEPLTASVSVIKPAE